MCKWLFVLVFFLVQRTLISQSIILDEVYDDWSQNDIVSEEIGDASGLDIESLSIANDDNYLYFKIDLDREVLLQSSSGILLAIDIDANANTGLNLEGMGAEIVFNFGQRAGRFYRGNNNSEIYHTDIGLITSPTVTSSSFEVAIRRDFIIDGNVIGIDGDISVYVLDNSSSTADYIPNRMEFARYTLKENVTMATAEFSLDPDADSDFRILSYNVKRDNIFDFFLRDSYQNIFNAIQSDIYCFQEVYDNSAEDLFNLLDGWGVLDHSTEWHYKKHGNDIITISKYPIVFSRFMAGNGLYVLDVNGTEVVVYNLHLPCCDNDSGRREEIDVMLANIRESRQGNSSYVFEDEAPIIILGDMNFVGFSEQVESILNGDIINNNNYGDDFIMDYDGTGLADLKPRTTGLSSSFTWYNPGSSFFPGRLDYIFYTDSRLEIKNSFTLFTEAMSDDWLDANGMMSFDASLASDHLPLVADFKFKAITSTEASVDDSGLHVYPNPFDAVLTLENRTDQKIKAVYARTVDGRLIYRHLDFSTETITLKDIGNYQGILMLEVYFENGRKTVVKLVAK